MKVLILADLRFRRPSKYLPVSGNFLGEFFEVVEFAGDDLVDDLPVDLLVCVDCDISESQ